MASDFHFYTDSFTRVNAALQSYVGNTSANVIGAIGGTAYTLLAIYVCMWGWSMMRGVISEPITDGVTRMVRLTVITALALNIGQYNTFIADFLWSSPDAMAAYVAGSSSSSQSNVQFLDLLMSKLYDLGDAYWQKARAGEPFIPDIGLTIAACLVWVGAISATAYGAFLLALSKMALAILLGIGPMFVLLLIFDGTKKFFEAWLGQALNYVFLVMLTAASIKLILNVIETYMGSADTVAAMSDPEIDAALPAITLCVIGSLVMMQLPSIASALGGGASISTLGAVGWAYGKAKGAAGGAKDLATGKTLSDMRGARRAKTVNARWARANPGLTARAAMAAARAPGSVYRRITNRT